VTAADGDPVGSISSAIVARGLGRRFGDVVAVDGIDLDIDRGELYALLGPNGAGKTTTIRMLCCLVRPTTGDATIVGRDVAAEPLAVKQVIAVSPQETAIAGHLNARENLELMARLHGMGAPEARARTDELLTVFGLLDRAGERVRHFSGGMQRRLSIAMALVSDPEVLFLDEPTLGLDTQARRALWRHIEELKGRITIVLTTHYLEEADALADRIAIIDRGRIVAAGTADELKALVPGSAATRIDAEVDDVALAALGDRFGAVRRVDGGVEIADDDVALDVVVDVLRPHDVRVHGTARRQVTLDDVFVHLTGSELR
jgi:ABC-2 type transport system ATP-binding protein